MTHAEVLAALPHPARLRDLCRVLAVLDAVLSPEWESRYYSFDPEWSDGEAMASMRNGSGDDWFCWFGDAGVAILGFDHESPMSPYATDPKRTWPGVTDGLPGAFVGPVLREPAFAGEDVTFLFWHELGNVGWRSGPVELPDDGQDLSGADLHLELVLADDPADYLAFAEDYYEATLSLADVTSVWSGAALTAELVSTLNPSAVVSEALAEADKLGHPVTR